MAIDRTVEQELEQARQLLLATIEATPDLVGTANMSGATLSLNRAGRAMLGVAPGADLSSLYIAECHPPWAAALLLDQAIPAAVRDGSWSGETALRHRDGHEIPVLQVIVAHRDDRGEATFLSTIIRDISLRKRDEQALRDSEARLQAVFEHVPFEFWACDHEGRCVLQNSASMTNWGRHVGSLASGFAGSEDARRKLAADTRRVLAGETVSEEVERLLEGRRRWYHQLIAPIRSDERVVGLIGVHIDITERKHLEDQLRQAQKMEAVGKLAGGIAHDFNNLLTAIMGFSGILLERHRPGDASHRPVEQIMKSAERAAALTGKLLAFSRKQVIQPRLIDLNAVVRDLSGLLRRLIGEDIALDLDLRTELWPVLADHAQLEQVLMNLAVNARDAMSNGGRLGIRTGNAPAAAEIPGIPQGDHVVLSVSDTGGGIAKDVLPHIFEPFFTTKRPGEGTGLGLSTVYGIVQQAGGQVTVNSREGEGSTFSVHLPRAEGSAPNPSGPHPVIRLRGNESLMVVEDEAQLRDLIAEMLRGAGYRVVVAASGEEAIGRYVPGVDFDLVITDVIMPVMSGRELAERLRKGGSKARALFISGYTDNIISAYGPLEPGTAFLQKPFTAETLLRKVREVIDG
ncbi:MAG: PAS domain S-box protein [Planctomycetes bacterium]|nr:PAS domain S-box protein [Planctomycetota bacterium]